MLRRAARLLGDGKRQIDAAARVGGEEFAMVLPATDSEGAEALAERLRARFQAEFEEDSVAITMSFGVAVYPVSGATAGSMLRAADEAVYAAKQGGRNRTVIHTRDLRDQVLEAGSNLDLEAERYVAIVLELAEAADLRFSGSARHSETVGRYAEMMAHELGVSEERIDRIRLAGVLHDVGKVGVPDSILRKPGKLNEDEWAKIVEHPALGAQILEHPALMDVREWVGAHHERPDGKGYPHGLTAAQIALEPAILAVADSYEAMTSDRSYRSAMSHAEAREELRRCVGAQFDPRVVEAFLNVLERVPSASHAGVV